MDKIDLVMALYDEQVTQARHHETLRVHIVSITLTIGGLMLAIVGWDNSISWRDAPSLVFLIFLGIFGAIASLKHYERNRMHAARARAMRKMAQELVEGSSIESALTEARRSHEQDNPFLSRSVRLKTIWFLAPLLISIIAFMLMIMLVTGAGMDRS